MLNKVILMGRLTSDPEIKTTSSGKSVTSFRIAVDRNYTKSGEERKADFFPIVAWGSKAEFICRYFRKGSLIALSGVLQQREYKDKSGAERSVCEVIAEDISFTGEKSNEAPSSGSNQSASVPDYDYDDLFN